MDASHPCPGDTHGRGLGAAPLETALSGEGSASPLARAHAQLKARGPLGRSCVAGPSPMSMRGLRGEAHPQRGSAISSIVALENMDGRVRSN